MREVANELTKKFFGQLWDDLIGYLKIYDFIKLKTQDFKGNSATISSVESFWYSILGDKYVGDRNAKYSNIRHGDVIKLKDVFLSEWAPKLPGRIWTFEGMESFQRGQKHIDERLSFNNSASVVLTPYGKEQVISAGFGSVRINRRKHDPENFMYMSLVDAKNWHCDFGIPVVVSKSVYKEYVKYSSHGTPWIKKLEGVLHIHDDLPFEQLLPKAIGASLCPEVESTLRYRPGLPKCYIHITSPLSIGLKYNDSNPDATAWTLFKSKVRGQPYMYTYINFCPRIEESTYEAVKFINWYIDRHRGSDVITDFDGMIPRLDASIPLKTNPLRSRKVEISHLLAECNKWAKHRLSDRFDY